MEILHPKQYCEHVEEKLINCEWNISEIPGVMNKALDNQYVYNNFYNLFFPIFSENLLENSIEYKNYIVYLINHSKSKNEIFLSLPIGPKIIYFVNNSNAQIKIEDSIIDLNDKKGKSIFLEECNKIFVNNSTNIQTCMVVLCLEKINQHKNIAYS